MKDVDIVGGGFSGQLSAYFLMKAGFTVTLYDSEPEISSGMLQTVRHSTGTLVENAANGILNSELLQTICKDIQITTLFPQKFARKRYFFIHKSFSRWPLSVSESLCLVFKILFRYLFRRSSFKPHSRETLETWSRRIGNLAFSKKIVDVATQGIYAQSAQYLSASLLLNRFFEAGREPSSIKVETVSFREGMQSFLTKIRMFNQNSGLRIVQKKYSEADLKEATTLGKRIFFCTPLKSLKSLLGSSYPEFCDQLDRLKMLPVTSCTAIFKKKYLPKKKPGFGALFARSENILALGVLYNDNIFEGRCAPDFVSETWIYSHVFNSETELRSQIMKDRTNTFHEEQEPVEFYFKSWPEALPSYDLDLEEWLEKHKILLREHARLHFVGNYCGHLSLSKILQRAEQESRRAQINEDTP